MSRFPRPIRALHHGHVSKRTEATFCSASGPFPKSGRSTQTCALLPSANWGTGFTGWLLSACPASHRSRPSGASRSPNQEHHRGRDFAPRLLVDLADKMLINRTYTSLESIDLQWNCLVGGTSIQPLRTRAKMFASSEPRLRHCRHSW